jgi:hypothetical protein
VKEVLGLISVQDEEDCGGFGEMEENLLKVFCKQASVVLMNCRRFSQVVEEAKHKKIDTSSADYLKSESVLAAR